VNRRGAPTRAAGAALALAALLTPACGRRGDEAWRSLLAAVPEPATTGREAADRAKILGAWRAAEAAAADREATPERVAAAYGELGRVCLAHEVVEAARASLANAAALAPDDRRWPYLAGVLEQGEGRVDEAAARFARALDLAPDDPATLVRLGEIDLERDRPDDARRRFARALAIPAAAAAAHFGLGRAAAAAGDPAAAVDHFERALAAQPAASAVRYPLGVALRDLGRRERAVEQLAAAGDREVEFPDPLIDELSELVTGARSYLRRAERAREEGDLERALQHYRLAVEADPEFALARLGLGTALGERGELGAAIAHLRRAADLDPALPEAHFNLATALLRLGRRDEALAALDRVLALDPGHHDARLRRAALWRDRGEPERARADLEAILARDPLDPGALANLAVLLARQGRAAEAERLLLDRLRQAPPPAVEARIHFALAFLAQERGRVEEAIDRYRRAVAASAGFAEGHFNLAVLLLQSGRAAAAAEAFGEVIRREPGNPRAHLGRGRAWIAAGRWPEARAALEAGLAELPADAALGAALAQLLSACPDPGVRDGRRALALAEAAFRARGGADAAEAAAMALAELGRFEEAVRWQRGLLAQAEAAGADPEARARLADELARYQAGRPIRWPDPGR
jgi:tetratricopeptide (TPR) repeat protein